MINQIVKEDFDYNPIIKQQTNKYKQNKISRLFF